MIVMMAMVIASRTLLGLFVVVVKVGILFLIGPEKAKKAFEDARAEKKNSF